MSAVQPLLVVELPPAFDQHLCLGAAAQPLAVKHLVPQLAVEALDESVLPRATRRDERRADNPDIEGPCVARGPDGPAPGPCRVVPTGWSFFFRTISSIPSMTSICSATNRLSRAISDLRSLSRLASVASRRPNLLRHRKRVCSVTLCFFAQGLDRHGADLGLAQDADDLLVGESILHGALLLKIKNSPVRWLHDPSQVTARHSQLTCGIQGLQTPLTSSSALTMMCSCDIPAAKANAINA